jgi:hypothetical protein
MSVLLAEVGVERELEEHRVPTPVPLPLAEGRKVEII